MNISQRGINAIKAHEGLRLVAYPDPASGGEPFTVGHGHTQGVKQGQTITAAQAEDFLREDLYWVEQCIRDTVRVPLNQEQYDALCSLIFNIGGGAFGRSTLLQRLNDGDYKAAAAEFMRWDMAAGKRMPGLTKRREAEMALFNAGPLYTSQPPVQKPPKTEHIPAGESGDAPENNMPIVPIVAAAAQAIAPDLLRGLGNTLINIFSPIAREKVRAELARHEIGSHEADQIFTAAVDAAKTVTGIADPVQATAAVTSAPTPEIVKAVEDDTLDTLERLAPLLDKMHERDKDAWAAEEAGRDAASRRAQGDAQDQDPYLTTSIVRMVVWIVVLLAVMIIALKYLGADAGTIGTLVGLFGAAVGTIIAKFGTRYDHRYGGSRGASANAAMLDVLARRQKGQP